MKLTEAEIEEKLIEAGVANLKEFGYPDVTKENIFTDDIYKQFFLSMLNENLGIGFDAPINKLKERLKK